MRSLRLVVLLAMLVPPTAIAQSVRDIVAAERLGAGYAQLLNLGATSDISSSSLRVDDGESRPPISIFRVPYVSDPLALTSATGLRWYISGSYLRMKESSGTTELFGAPGAIDAHWDAWSVTAGARLETALGGGFTLEPGFNLSLARLLNEGQFRGSAGVLQPLLDGLIVNWHTNAWLATPNLGLAWKHDYGGERMLTLRAHTAWTWVHSFDESDPVIRFRETAGTWSIRGDYVAPVGMAIAGRALYYSANAGYGGFFGNNRDALGFTTIAELGLGIEAAMSTSAPNKRVRLGVSYLFGPDVRGWSVGLAFAY